MYVVWISSVIEIGTENSAMEDRLTYWHLKRFICKKDSSLLTPYEIVNQTPCLSPNRIKIQKEKSTLTEIMFVNKPTSFAEECVMKRQRKERREIIWANSMAET
jgi:hypothetical protein